MVRFILVHHISKLSRLIQKYKGLIGKVVMFGQDLVPIGHKSIFLSNFKIWKWFWWLRVLYHPQQLIFTKQEYWHKKFVQTCQSSSKHSLDLEARVLNFKGAYLAHLLVFFSDSKDILLFKIGRAHV